MIATVLIRGFDVNLQDSGRGSPALLWAHGFGSCIAHEDSAGLVDFRHIAECSRLIRWDARGHGESGAPFKQADAYTWGELALDTIAIAEQHRLEPVVLGGLSMGAATALHAAVADPGRTAGLVLVLPPTAYEYRRTERTRYLALAHVVEAEGISGYMNASKDVPLPPFLRDMPLEDRIPEQAPAVLSNLLRGAAASDLPSTQELASITSPALILAWPGDPGHPMSVAENIAATLKNAELRVASDLRDVANWSRAMGSFLAACGQG